MKNLLLRLGAFAFQYPWLALSIAGTLFIAIDLLADMGDLRPAFYIDMGLFWPLLFIAAMYTAAGFDLRRLVEDRRHV